MSHQSLTRSGYVLKKKHLDDKQKKQIHKDLTFKPLVMPAFMEMAKPQPFSTYLESELRYYLPRYYAIEKFGSPIKDLLTENISETNFRVYWDLLPHQEKAWTALETQFGENGPKGGILSLPCGWGKTFCAIKLSEWLKVKTIVVVHKEFLMKQWKEAIEKCSDARIGIIQRDKVDVEDKDIVIAMLQSISMKEYEEDIFAGFGLTIIDESHHIASQTFSKALPKIACKYTLGLSATPIRKDGLTQVFLNYLGPVFHVERRSGMNNVWCKIIEIKSESEHFGEERMKNGNKDTGKMTTKISEFEALNYFIMEMIASLIKEKPRHVLVLGPRREQLEWFNEKFPEQGYKNHKNKYATSGLYYGNQGMNKTLYWKMMDESSGCDVIWGTNDIAREGLDIPTLNTLVLLSGGCDVEQAAGRILRKHHEEVPPTIIDIVYKCGNFPRHGTTRQDYYEDENYIMQKETIDIEEGFKDECLKELVEKLNHTTLEKYPERGEPGVYIRKRRKKKPETNMDMEEPEDLPVPSTRSIKVMDPGVRRTLNVNLVKKKPPSLKVFRPEDLADNDSNEGDYRPSFSKPVEEKVQEDNISEGSGGADTVPETPKPSFIPLTVKHIKTPAAAVGATVISCDPVKQTIAPSATVTPIRPTTIRPHNGRFTPMAPPKKRR